MSLSSVADPLASAQSSLPQAAEERVIPRPFGLYFNHNSLKLDRRGSTPVTLQVGPSLLLFSEHASLVAYLARQRQDTVRPSTKAVYEAAVSIGLPSIQFLMLQVNKSMSLCRVTWNKDGLPTSQHRQSILRPDSWSSMVFNSLSDTMAQSTPVQAHEMLAIPARLYLPFAH